MTDPKRISHERLRDIEQRYGRLHPGAYARVDIQDLLGHIAQLEGEHVQIAEALHMTDYAEGQGLVRVATTEEIVTTILADAARRQSLEDALETETLKAETAQTVARSITDELHPRGRCTCAGEGHCPYCLLIDSEERRMRARLEGGQSVVKVLIHKYEHVLGLWKSLGLSMTPRIEGALSTMEIELGYLRTQDQEFEAELAQRPEVPDGDQ
jgi:hypothetical protein